MAALSAQVSFRDMLWKTVNRMKHMESFKKSCPFVMKNDFWDSLFYLFIH